MPKIGENVKWKIISPFMIYVDFERFMQIYADFESILVPEDKRK